MITYAVFHAVATVPTAVFLTGLAAPFLARAHGFQIAGLCLVAFCATLPWDAYLISQRIWTYPPSAVVGPALLGIPVEELFFFIVQTYITSLLYIVVNKPLLHVQYLHTQGAPPNRLRWAKQTGQFTLLALAVFGVYLVWHGGTCTYMGLILAWAAPFALITWTIAGVFILSLPWFATIVPVLVPTLYFWVADHVALDQGVWQIADGSKLGVRLFGALEIEEAVFFVATNTLVVLGLAAFDHYLAVMDAFPSLFLAVPQNPSPVLLLEERLINSANYDMDRVAAIRDAVNRLQKKSRSFYLASAMFSGRTRIDLILLYSFCRTADDLVDNAKSGDEVKQHTTKLRRFLSLRYSEKGHAVADRFVDEEFPPSARSALKLLPTSILPREPLQDLISGFEIDARFGRRGVGPAVFPVADEQRLEYYASCVAGSVGKLCVALIAHHHEPTNAATLMEQLGDAADHMGIALQYVNIARDIETDAEMGRVYIPTTWLCDEGMSPEDVLEHPASSAVDRLRRRLLDRAFGLYNDALPHMRRLPRGTIRPLRVAVENYMDIGRVMRGKSTAWQDRMRQGKGTVPLHMRAWTTVDMLWIESEDGDRSLHHSIRTSRALRPA